MSNTDDMFGIEHLDHCVDILRQSINKKNRVENEVAIINLVAAALSHIDPKVVPCVYGWGSAAAESSQGWILQELMPGQPVDAVLDKMDLQGKQAIFAQMSEMLSALQKYQLPQGITGFGGLKFDAAGRIVSAAMSSVDAGPWPSYEAFYKRPSENCARRSRHGSLHSRMERQWSQAATQRFC